MVRVSLDSNVLIYAVLEPQSDKGRLSEQLIRRTAHHAVLATQALLEFVAVVRRRAPDRAEQAIVQAEAWASVFETAPTTQLVAGAAMKLVRDHKFQVWDAVIHAAVSAAGAKLLFSEDMQDGLTLEGMRIVDPYKLGEEDLSGLLSA